VTRPAFEALGRIVLPALVIAAASGAASAQDHLRLVAPSDFAVTAEPGARAEMRIESQASQGVFFDTSIFERTPDGKLVRLESPPFAFAPAMGLLEAGRSQRFELEWRAETLERGRLFLIYFDQLPIDQTSRPDGAAVRLRLSMGVSLTANPAETAPRLEASEIQSEAEGWSARLDNDSPHILVLSRGAFRADGEIRPGTEALEVNPDSYLYPGESRRFWFNGPAPARLIWSPEPGA